MKTPQRQERNRRITALYFGAGVTKTEIARLLNLDFITVWRIIRGAEQDRSRGDRTDA